MPTRLQNGYSGDLYCGYCGELIEKGHVIPATGSAILPVLPTTPGSLKKPDAPMPFTDVATGDWFYDDVKYVYEEGLMNGTGETKFSPYATLTRGMVVTILYRMEGEPTVRYNGIFSDVPNYQWYTDAVEWAAKYDIVTGYTNGKFGPEDPVTREQLAAILFRYVRYKGYNTSSGDSLDDCIDGAAVSSYAIPAVQWAVAEDMLQADSGRLRPTEYANRAEVAAAISCFDRTYAD